MKIKKIELKNFKRFTDLVIDEIPSNAKLVLLIGSNGSGKSSVFDAFSLINNLISGADFDKNYYEKEKNGKSEIILVSENSKISLTDLLFSKSLNLQYVNKPFSPHSPHKKPFYGRTSFRQISRLSETLSGSINISQDNDRPKFFIDSDLRFKMDVPLWLEKILSELFDEKAKTEEILAKLTNPLNQAFANIFGEDATTALRLKNVLPQRNGESIRINFEKGDATFSYDFLSAGEKEVFGILLNLLVRRDEFQETIYFFDELDLHLNTSLQYTFLKEITENWIPENCQLWTASHSLGFIDYARETENAVIIDFDNYDFDIPQRLLPQSKETLEIFEIAVPKETIFRIFDGKQIILCENKDDDFYNLLGLENKIFVGVQNKDEVFRNIKSNSKYFGLIDRDFLADNEVNTLKAGYPNLFILDFYNFENYLYHPENIKEVAADFDTETYKQDLINQKRLQFENTLLNLKTTRTGYKILRDENLSENKDNLDSIVQSLKSDNFSEFYKFFNMKNANHSFLESNKLKKNQLARTNWFKLQIQKIIETDKV